jgi:hypothetical protein
VSPKSSRSWKTLGLAVAVWLRVSRVRLLAVVGGLGDFETPPAPPQVLETSESDSFDDDTPAPAEHVNMENALQRLQDKFGKNR